MLIVFIQHFPTVGMFKEPADYCWRNVRKSGMWYYNAVCTRTWNNGNVLKEWSDTVIAHMYSNHSM